MARRRSRTPSRSEDDIDLLYRLSPSGWSDLVVLHEHDVHQFNITHIFSDPLGDLIALCTDLLKGADACDVRLPDEPGATLIEVRRHADQRHIVSVRLIDCNDKDEQTCVAAFNIKVRQLVDLFYYQFAKLRALSRERRYREARDDFPEETFLTLKALREES